MVSALDSGSGGPGSRPGLGTALCSYSHSASLHPGEFTVWGNPAMD